MLFIIDPEIEEAVRNSSHPDHDDACVELERLALARWRRKAIIFFESKGVVSAVAESPRFSQRSKAVFLNAYRARAFKGDLMRSLSVRVRLVLCARSGGVEERGGVSEIIVPIAAVPHGLFDAAIVLAENINDAKCYLIFGRIAALAGLGRVPKVWVAAELRGGGGSAIEGEYKQLKASGERLVLCLLDSDLRFPDCEPSAWRKRIIEHDEGVPSAYASAYPTGVYSVENLIPTEVITSLKTYAADASKVRALAEDAKHWRQHAALDHWGFIALKKGVGCRALRGEAGGGAYWQDRSQHFSGYSSKGCASPIANCRHDCLRLPAYPGDLLSTFVAEFEEANERSLTQVAVSIAPAVIAKFEEVVKRVVAWCCVGGAVGAAGAG